MNSEDRTNVAQELAARDGRSWEGLSPGMVNAYLHNADVFIEQRNRPPVDEFTGKPVYTCDKCQDKAYFAGKRCPECNPMGLPAAQVHPQVESRPDDSEEGEKIGDFMGDGEADIQKVAHNLYELQQEKVAAEALAKKEVEEAEARQTEEGKEAIRQNRELTPSEYRCSKCSKPGKTVIHILQKSGKGIGQKHLEFAVKDD